MVWRLYPGVGTRFSVPVRTGPGAHLTSCVVGTGFLSCGGGIKLPGLGCHGLFLVAILGAWSALCVFCRLDDLGFES
jgi:hypothetical protein